MPLPGLVLAFLCGSVPFGWLLARLRGVDVRAAGSGNIGAANVSRLLGKRLGAAVLALDAAKGALPVALARSWPSLGVGSGIEGAVGSTGGLALVGLAAVLGHCFTPWLRFRGGKGVATSLGIFLVLDPVGTALAVGVFVVACAVTRIVSVGSLLAAAALPVGLALLGRPRPLVLVAATVVVLVVALHRENLARLRHGTEGRLS